MRALGVGRRTVTLESLAAAFPRSGDETREQQDRDVHVRGDQASVSGTVVATRRRGASMDTVRIHYPRVYAPRPGGLRLVSGVVSQAPP